MPMHFPVMQVHEEDLMDLDDLEKLAGACGRTTGELRWAVGSNG